MIAGLRATKEMLSGWSASSKATADIQRLIDLMSNHEDLSVAQFCAKVEKALNAQGAEHSPTSNSKEIYQQVADDYIEKMRSPQLSRGEMTNIIDEIKKDKKCRLQELDYIANALTNAGRKYRSKKNALEDIQRYGHRRLDVDRRMQDTSGVF